MWFHLGLQNFIAKKTFDIEFYDVFVSDCIHIWHKRLSNYELLSISQTLNPLLEVSVAKLKDLTSNSLEDAEAKKEMKIEDNNATLKIESNLLGLKFRFQISLNQGNNEMFYEEFTLPLLIMLINTQKREKRLMKIIEDKDVEIAEYKQENGHTKCFLMATKPFSKEEFDCEYPAANLNWNFSSFLNNIGEYSSVENVCKEKLVQSNLEDKDNKFFAIKKCEEKQSVFTNKNSNQKIGCKSCVNLDNQTLKKRKKPTDTEKLKL